MPPKNLRIYDAFAITNDGTMVPIKEFKDIELSDIEPELERMEYKKVRHGTWIEAEDEFGPYIKCPECGGEYIADYWVINNFNYCPRCGAKMDREEAAANEID